VNRQLLILTIAAGVLFVVGLVWFVFRANTRSNNTPAPGPAALFDTDQDGLNDAREEELGTNPADDDTDFDGLTDLEEVTVYQTSPLIADTDGDTFVDGIEVRGGYDPLVPAAQ
jgi:hypothetical protein